MTNRNPLVPEALGGRERMLEDADDIVLGQGVEDKDPAAGQEGAVDFKGRIFRGRA